MKSVRKPLLEMTGRTPILESSIGVKLSCLVFLVFTSCTPMDKKMKGVSVKEFSNFVEETNYVTDAERYGWSFVQKTVFEYDIVQGANWRFPDGKTKAKSNNPITQVSLNDALAYCNWIEAKLPTYDEYWVYANEDKMTIIADTTQLFPVAEANVVGNTWDITTSKNIKGEIRLAGGSYLCNETTCNGTKKERVLYVSPDTGNSHISFSIIRKE